MYLPDINVWLALAFQSHAHHTLAKRWFEGVAEGGCSFCRFTQQGLLRLATNRQVVGGEAVSLAQAWRIYDALLSDPRVVYAEEPADLEVYWREYTQRQSRSPHLWGDAYLAAFAKARALELVTCDKAFRQFKKTKFIVLS